MNAMNTRVKKSIVLIVMVIMVLSMAIQSFAAPLSYAKPAAQGGGSEKVTGTWNKDAAGNWNFRSQDGAAKDGWYYLNTTNKATDYNWFHFTNGVMNTGWVQDKKDPSVWYYTGVTKDSSEGGLVKGWVTDPRDGRKYYMDPSTGTMCYGWKQLDGVWYYFGEKQYENASHPYGSMYANEKTPDGYYVGSSGAWGQNTSSGSNSSSHKPTPVTTYTVRFDIQGHGTQINPITGVTSGSKITAPTPAPTETGYTFGGWYKEALCTNAWNFGTDTVTGNTTLYAKWTTIPLTNHSVTFNLNGATGIVAPDPQTVVSGGKATEPTAPTFVNHTLEGWYKTKNADGTLSDKWDFETGKVTGDMSLYAQWTRHIANIIATVDFPTSSTNAWVNSSNTNIKVYEFNNTMFKILYVEKDNQPGPQLVYYGGSITADNAVKNGNSYIYRNNLQKYTVTFSMTNEDKLGSIVVTALDGASQDIKDAAGTYSAPAAVVSVTGVSLNKTSTTLSIGESETLTATIVPTDATNKNVTWSSSDESVATVNDGNVSAVSAGTATITVTTDDGGKTATCIVNVTAPAPTEYTVTFDVNGVGTAPDSKTVEQGGTVTKPDDPTDTIHTFDGWYKTKADATTYEPSEKWNFDNDAVTGNITLYAKWTKKMVDIIENAVPVAESQYEPPTGAWRNNEDKFAYVYNNSLMIHKDESSDAANNLLCSTSKEFTRVDENTYVFKYVVSGHNVGVYTFNLENGSLSSINYNGSDTSYSHLSGTYCAPASLGFFKSAPKPAITIGSVIGDSLPTLASPDEAVYKAWESDGSKWCYIFCDEENDGEKSLFFKDPSGFISISLDELVEEEDDIEVPEEDEIIYKYENDDYVITFYTRGGNLVSIEFVSNGNYSSYSGMYSEPEGSETQNENESGEEQNIPTEEQAKQSVEDPPKYESGESEETKPKEQEEHEEEGTENKEEEISEEGTGDDPE